jgi:hypothetical protein
LATKFRYAANSQLVNSLEARYTHKMTVIDLPVNSNSLDE